MFDLNYYIHGRSKAHVQYVCFELADTAAVYSHAARAWNVRREQKQLAWLYQHVYSSSINTLDLLLLNLYIIGALYQLGVGSP